MQHEMSKGLYSSSEARTAAGCRQAWGREATSWYSVREAQHGAPSIALRCFVGTATKTGRQDSTARPAGLTAVPLKAMCSRKWAVPLVTSLS